MAHITETIVTNTVTERERSKQGEHLALTAHDVVNIVTDDELSDLLLLLFTWMETQRYMLQGTPEEMLARVLECRSE